MQREIGGALEVLTRGRDYLIDRHARFDPHPDGAVGKRYNEKAQKTWERYGKDAARLQKELDRLAARSD